MQRHYSQSIYATVSGRIENKETQLRKDNHLFIIYNSFTILPLINK